MQHIRVFDLKAAKEYYRKHKELRPGKDAMVMVQGGEATLMIFGAPELDAEKSTMSPGLAPAAPDVCPHGALTLTVEAKPKKGKKREILFALPLATWFGEFRKLIAAKTLKVLLVAKNPQVLPQPGELPIVAVRWPAAEFPGGEIPPLLAALFLAEELRNRLAG